MVNPKASKIEILDEGTLVKGRLPSTFKFKNRNSYTKYNFEFMNKNGYLIVPPTNFSVRTAAYQWGKRNGATFTTKLVHDKEGTVKGIAIIRVD